MISVQTGVIEFGYIFNFAKNFEKNNYEKKLKSIFSHNYIFAKIKKPLFR